MSTLPKRNNPGLIREKLLDSAESLFAQHGFDGVSVRDIVAHAGLRLSALTYHFGSKDELFARVVARRSPEFAKAIDESLQQALVQAGDQAPTAEAVVRAYLEPSFRLSMTGGAGWKNYIQLITRSMNMRQNAEVLAPLWTELDPLQKELNEVFSRVNPRATQEDLNWGVYFLVAATIHVLVEAGLVDRQSNGLCSSSDLPTILDKMIPFFAAGFERLTNISER